MYHSINHWQYSLPPMLPVCNDHKITMQYCFGRRGGGHQVNFARTKKDEKWSIRGRKRLKCQKLCHWLWEWIWVTLDKMPGWPVMEWWSAIPFVSLGAGSSITLTRTEIHKDFFGWSQYSFKLNIWLTDCPSSCCPKWPSPLS